MSNISNIKFLKKFTIVLLSLSLLYLNSCGLYRPTDARKVSPNADERVKKNQAEGKGFSLGGFGKNKCELEIQGESKPGFIAETISLVFP